MKTAKRQARQERDWRQRLAAEQAALHATRLVLARWGSGHSYAEWQVARTMQPKAQLDWYDAVQHDFQLWLAAGGFACAEKKFHLNENSGYDTAVLMSRCGTHCEESKFSQDRMRDAVE